MSSPRVTAGTDLSPWEFVSPSAYALPTPPVTHSARERFATFRRLFHRAAPQSNAPVKAQDKLSAIPGSRLEKIVSPPDWPVAAAALDAALVEWLEKDSRQAPVMIIIGAPFSGNRDALEAWAEMHSLPILPCPAPSQVLEGQGTWLATLPAQGALWVLPNLEKVYLRHVEGLQLFRRFIDHVCTGKMGKGIIGCDSWAWAFLQHVWPGPAPAMLTLQAADASRLSNHFYGQFNASTEDRLLFRQSDSGQYIFPPGEIEATEGRSNFLQIVAAYSRGIYGVAQAVWRTSMQAEPEEQPGGSDDGEQSYNIPEQTVWILPWEQVTLPALPSGAGRDEAFVLQTLLLHNGLPLELLHTMMPLTHKQVTEALYRLEASELVGEGEGSDWQIAPQGYPAVRQFLQSRRYLVDQF